MAISQIKTKQDHENALNRIKVLWEAEPNTPQGEELDELATLISVYESEKLKMDFVKSRFENIDESDLADGKTFFEDLDSGKYD